MTVLVIEKRRNGLRNGFEIVRLKKGQETGGTKIVGIKG